MKSKLSIFLFCAILTSCKKKSDVTNVYHPIEQYIQKTNVLNLTLGRKVAIIVNTNGCHACISQANDVIVQVKNPNVKLIYSVANRGMLEREIEVSSQDSVTYYIDNSHTPFRKGIVGNMPVAYFLENGLMVDSVQLTTKTLENVYEFIGNEKQSLSNKDKL